VRRQLVSFCTRVLALPGRALGRHKRTPELPDRSRTQRILVVKLWAIGEVLMSLPALESLRRAFPAARITLLVGQVAAGVVRHNPNLDEVVEVDEQTFLKPRLGALWRLSQDLRRRRFDLALSFHHSLPVNLFLRATGSRVRAGFDRRGEGWPLTHRIPWEQRLLHQTEEYHQVVSQVSGNGMGSPAISGKAPPLVFRPSAADLERADEVLAEVGLDRPLIALLPTGGSNAAASGLDSNIHLKVWPPSFYGELAKLLVERLSARVVVVGAEAEQSARDEILRIARDEVVDLVGKLSLGELGALLARCDLVVTNDSGPMHLAAAVGAPLLALFGPTDPRLCGPRSRNAKVFQRALPCSPCFEPNTFPNRVPPCSNPNYHECLRSFTPEMRCTRRR